MSNNATLINASICVTDLIDAYKKGHSAFNVGKKNGKVYANISEWINPEPNQFGQHSSIVLNSGKDMQDKDAAIFGGKVYIGNGVKADFGNASIPADQRDQFNDVPGTLVGSGNPAPATNNQPQGGLPF